MKVSFCSLSVGASLDQQSGSVSVFDIVDEFKVGDVPVQIQNLALVVGLRKTASEDFLGSVFIHFVSSDGKSVKIAHGQLKVPSQQKTTKALFKLNNFPISQLGEHKFVVSVLDNSSRKVAEGIVEFDVNKVEVKS